MQFSVRPFRKLQWQLSLSYTLVAVGALLVVELLLIGILLVVINSDAMPRLLAQTFREQFSANLRAFLDRPEPDIEGITRFMTAFSTPEQSASTDTYVWSVQDSDQNMLVVDAQARVLWAQFTGEGIVPGEPIDPESITGLSQILPEALANEKDNSRLYRRTGSLLVMAVPIENEARDRALGVIILLVEMPTFTSPSFLSQVLPTILGSLLLFTLFAGLVGSVFGYFTARRLTGRLGRVASAADAWSRGDFSTFINEPAGDELGAMARRLNTMAEQLQNLLHTRQELAALEERNRIARELHDSVKQQVFASSMQLGAARALLEGSPSPEDQQAAARHLDEADRLNRQAQNELNALIRQLRPRALEGKGLSRALRELAEDWSRQTGIAARVDVETGQNDPPLPLHVEQALYRVAQEALANAAKHSQAGSVRLGYTRSARQACLTIEDDGVGFDPNQAYGRGVGLKSMRERVESIDGRLEIIAEPGKGSKLGARVRL